MQPCVQRDHFGQTRRSKNRPIFPYTVKNEPNTVKLITIYFLKSKIHQSVKTKELTLCRNTCTNQKNEEKLRYRLRTNFGARRECGLKRNMAFKSIQTEQIEVFYSLIKSLSPRMMTQICVIFRHTEDVALVLVQLILKVIVIQ